MSIHPMFAETRVTLIDWCDPSDEVYLDHPGKVVLHLSKPNTSVETNAEDMLNPEKVAWQVNVQRGGRHRCHGYAFETAETRGQSMKRWNEILDMAEEAIHGEVINLREVNDGTA